VLFNSLTFLIFLPLVVAAYYLLPHRMRWVLLLIASYFFYGYWKVEYLSLIVLSTVVDFVAAQIIAQSSNTTKRRIALAISLCTNLGLLAFFKYAGWFVEDVLYASSLVAESSLMDFKQVWNFLLPVGISFYTFQTMSYTIDVYHGQVEPERNPFKFALFVSYFPQLVAGPIERFSHLHPQLFKRHTFSYASLQHGGRLLLYGFFIKMCVADQLSPIADQIFTQVDQASTWQLFVGMWAFGIQIYADFHGYSLIAIGSARLLGVELMDNFNAPYTATSIRAFWNRWHISLSTWFRDYLYIPLGGNQNGWLKWSISILAVFLISGLWHGANWTFVVWGALHGLAYLMERFFLKDTSSKWVAFPKWVVTMAVVFVAWIFFRSPTIEAALHYAVGLTGSGQAGIHLEWEASIIGIIGLFLLSDLAFRDRGFHHWMNRRSPVSRWAIYGLMLFLIAAQSGTVHHPFIYFQF
jgi:alginate O-acetyltransferase complex protein AlgI